MKRGKPLAVEIQEESGRWSFIKWTFLRKPHPISGATYITVAKRCEEQYATNVRVTDEGRVIYQTEPK